MKIYLSNGISRIFINTNQFYVIKICRLATTGTDNHIQCQTVNTRRDVKLRHCRLPFIAFPTADDLIQQRLSPAGHTQAQILLTSSD
ncbi:MAG: hypothetical protein V8T87_01550, partial [Victivallales bacterium]